MLEPPNIQLDPSRITGHLPFEVHNIEEAIFSKALLPIFQESLIELFFNSDVFSKERVVEEFHHSLQKDMRTLIEFGLERDRKLYAALGGWYTEDFTDVIQRAGINPAEIADEKLPAPFSSKIMELVETSSFAIQCLEKVRAQPLLFGILKDLYRLSIEAKQTKNSAALFQYAIDLKETLPIKIPFSAPEDLYFLTLLPITVRYCVQGILIAALHADYLENLKKNAQENERPLVEDLIRYMSTIIITDSHLENLSKEFAVSPELALIFNRGWTERALIVRECMKYPQDVRMKIIGKFNKFTSGVREVVCEIDSQAPLNEAFQFTDVGHCFPGYENNIAPLKEKDADLNRSARKRRGKYAIILEDDASQMQRYADVIGKASRYSLLMFGLSKCTKPESAVKRARLGIGLFLIDIENAGNKTAGIIVAKQVIEKILNPWLISEIIRKAAAVLRALGNRISENRFRDPKPVKIIVWSSSDELVKKARDEVIKFCRTNGYSRLVNYPGNEYSPVHPAIELEFRSKARKLYL
jgi:hypothetical protein